MLGDDESMSMRERVDVEEGEGLVGFEQFHRGNITYSNISLLRIEHSTLKCHLPLIILQKMQLAAILSADIRRSSHLDGLIFVVLRIHIHFGFPCL